MMCKFFLVIAAFVPSFSLAAGPADYQTCESAGGIPYKISFDRAGHKAILQYTPSSTPDLKPPTVTLTEADYMIRNGELQMTAFYPVVTPDLATSMIVSLVASPSNPSRNFIQFALNTQLGHDSNEAGVPVELESKLIPVHCK